MRRFGKEASSSKRHLAVSVCHFWAASAKSDMHQLQLSPGSGWGFINQRISYRSESEFTATFPIPVLIMTTDVSNLSTPSSMLHAPLCFCISYY